MDAQAIDLGSGRRRPRRWLSLAVGILVGGLVSGGVALASIPDGSGVFHGCELKSSGALRVIDTAKGQKCSASEAPITWNQRGPAGTPGPKGSAGATGPRGPSDLYNVFSGAALPGFTETRVATLSLPAGRYLVSAHVSVTNYAPDAPVGCRLYVNYNNSLTNKIDQTVEDVAAANTAGDVVDFPLQGAVYYTSAGYAIVACTENQNRSSGDPGGASATLDAVAVGAIH